MCTEKMSRYSNNKEKMNYTINMGINYEFK